MSRQAGSKLVAVSFAIQLTELCSCVLPVISGILIEVERKSTMAVGDARRAPQLGLQNAVPGTAAWVELPKSARRRRASSRSLHSSFVSRSAGSVGVGRDDMGD